MFFKVHESQLYKSSLAQEIYRITRGALMRKLFVQSNYIYRKNWDNWILEMCFGRCLEKITNSFTRARVHSYVLWPGTEILNRKNCFWLAKNRRIKNTFALYQSYKNKKHFRSLSELLSLRMGFNGYHKSCYFPESSDQSSNFKIILSAKSCIRNEQICRILASFSSRSVIMWKCINQPEKHHAILIAARSWTIKINEIFQSKQRLWKFESLYCVV